MATIREYFDTDAKELTVHAVWTLITEDDITLGNIDAKIAYNFEANAKYWYFYVPSDVDLPQCLSWLFASSELKNCYLAPEGDTVYVEKRDGECFERQTTATQQFTKKLFSNLHCSLRMSSFNT